MNTISEEYWVNDFEITSNDLSRIAERMKRDQVPQDLKTISMSIIHGRLEHGNDLSPAAIVKFTGNPSVRLWDPESLWQEHDLVLVARTVSSGEFEAFLGEILFLDSDNAKIYIEELDKKITFARLLPNTKTTREHGKNADVWRNTVRETVEKKINSTDVNQQAKGVFLQYGERIINQVDLALASDSRFIGLEGKWYLVENLPEFKINTIEPIYHLLLEKPQFAIADMLQLLKLDAPQITTRMSIEKALKVRSEYFDYLGTTTRSFWKALPPIPDKARVIRYAYDPKTFEILCSPGQDLNPKNAQRMMDLDIYRYVVTIQKEVFQ